MNIQASAFQTGLQGFNNAQQNAAEAAIAIVDVTGSQRALEQNSTDNSRNGNVNSLANESTTNLSAEIVNLKVAEYQAKASAKVIKTADENLGTLLDVTV